MIERRDYYVLDQYDDVWNDVAINTFKNAWDWRNFIRPLINRDALLRIESVPRGSEYIFVPRKV